MRYAALKQAIAEDRAGRAAEVGAEIELALQNEVYGGLLMGLLQNGRLPLRVTHNDTKLNNVLFDRKTRAALCVIDLDTVMPGLAANDFGDSIRFGASTGAEDEEDTSLVGVSIPLFTAYTKGFLGACGGNLTPEEIAHLPDGAVMMTLECGVRFLTDYLNGDVYFAIHKPRHNLLRARAQLALVQSLQKNMAQLQEIVLQNTEG